MEQKPREPEGKQPKQKVVHLRAIEGAKRAAPLALLKELVESIEKGELDIEGIVLASFVQHEGQQCFHVDAAGIDGMQAIYLLERGRHEIMQGEVYGYEEEG